MPLKDLSRLLTLLSTVLRPTDLPARDGEPMTSYSFRRTAPALATSTNLLLHEYLPFGSWQGGALEKKEREAVKGAKMALLYADGTAKGQAEELVKVAVWSLVDTVRAVKG